MLVAVNYFQRLLMGKFVSEYLRMTGPRQHNIDLYSPLQNFIGCIFCDDHQGSPLQQWFCVCKG